MRSQSNELVNLAHVSDIIVLPDSGKSKNGTVVASSAVAADVVYTLYAGPLELCQVVLEGFAGIMGIGHSGSTLERFGLGNKAPTPPIANKTVKEGVKQ